MKHEVQVGGRGSDTNPGNPHHEHLPQEPALPGAVRCGHKQEGLAGDPQGLAVGLMAPAIANAKPAIDRQVHREEGQIKHHPAEDTRHQGAVGHKRMGSQGIGDGAQGHARGEGAGGDHGDVEDAAPAQMQRPALLAEHGHPEGHKPHGPGGDVPGKKSVKRIHAHGLST